MFLPNLLPSGSISVSQMNATRAQFLNQDMAVTQQGLTEALQLLSHAPEVRGGTREHPNNLANFTASAAVGKQGLAKQARVGVYRYVHMYKYMC